MGFLLLDAFVLYSGRRKYSTTTYRELHNRALEKA